MTTERLEEEDRSKLREKDLTPEQMNKPINESPAG
jgi:hypothetical protein